MGPPEFSENPVPTWEEFCDDYRPHFFDGSRPEAGRSFVIEHASQAVGHISYDCRPPRDSFAELDVWMRDAFCCGRGFGSAALRLLSEHLHTTFGIREQILRPSARNVRAVRSYAKAGFAPLQLSQEQQAQRYGPGEYHDTVVMQRVWR